MANSIKFSPSDAWNRTVVWIKDHLQIFIALAGVFFLLPALVLNFFGPQPVEPVIDPNGTLEVLFAQLMDYFRPFLPWIVLISLIQMVGQLAVIAVAASRGNASAGDAIGVGFRLIGYLVLVQIVFGLLFGAVMLVVGLFAGLIPALGFVIAIAAIPVVAYVSARLSLISAVLVGETDRWPLALIQRSWQLTAGNGWMIFLFYLIVIIVFLVIAFVIGLVFGIALLAAGDIGVSIATVVEGVVSAAGTVVFSLMPVAVWQQLSGSSAETSEVFS